jgi:hypothetical protein
MSSVIFEVNEPSSTRSWRECFQALEKHVSHSTLNSLFFAEGAGELVDDTLTILGILLTPLYIFSNLTKFTLKLSCPLELDDTGMAMVWPRPRELSLPIAPTGFQRHVDRPLPFARCSSCADLISLWMPQRHRYLSQNQEQGFPIHWRQAELWQLPNIPGRIKHCSPLTRHFPERVFYPLRLQRPDYSQLFEDRWEQVQNLIPVFAKVRLQERLFRGNQNIWVVVIVFFLIHWVSCVRLFNVLGNVLNPAQWLDLS